jgi:hypothetical protein
MSGARAGTDPTAVQAAKVGRTRHLPRGSSQGAGATSTLGGYASEIGETTGGPSAGRRPGRWFAIGGLALLGVAGLLLFMIGGPRKQARDSHARQTGDSVGKGPEAASSEAPEPAPRARPTERAADPSVAPAARQRPTDRAEPPAPSVPTAVPGKEGGAGATVVLRITSVPPGASVVESRTGKALGATPFEAAFPRAAVEARLTLQKHGYCSRELTLKLDQDAGLSVTLDKRASTTIPDRVNDARRKL